MQIDAATELDRQLVLLAKEHQAWVPAGQVFDEHVDVAVRSESARATEPKSDSLRMPRSRQKAAISPSSIVMGRLATMVKRACGR